MFLLALLLACPAKDTPPHHEWPAVVAGAPRAGTAEGSLRLPVGTPLAGYSSRCGYLGGSGAQDHRDSHYTVGFVESTGVQTRPQIKVLWLENGDEHMVLVKVDIIYSFDGLVEALEERLEAATGENLDGKVVVATNHSHASYGPFSDSYHFYLGGDRYDEELFQRFVSQATGLAMEAYEGREDVALGTGWAKDWDPDNAVYRDRRGDNDSLAVWDDMEPGYDKDPHLNVLRVDSLAGEPVAMVFTFGIHGTSLGEDNPMVSSDAPGHLEVVLQEQFDDEVLVMHLQGAGGDASPAGRDSGYARLESVGEGAVAGVMGLWAETPTSSAPISMELASRSIPQDLETISVTRNGEVDWRYLASQEGYLADDLIYDENGNILSPLDEFNAPFGAAFCGSDAPLIPAGNIGTEVYPYSACMDVELVSWVLLGIFKLTEEWGMEDMPLPMPSALRAGTTAGLIGPLATRDTDGSESERDLLVGFFPGESTAMFTEQWRRRAKAELGHAMALHVGYAQDHEGYLLIPEDWLMGGYEPNINIWGPLQAEYLMEQVLHYAGTLLGNGIHEPSDPLGQWAPTVYPDRDLPERHPDATPDAGTLLTEVGEDFWIPLDLALELETPASVPRVTGIVQLAWEGGDPVVDQPTVTLQRKNGDTWETVTSRSGRAITEVFGDILLGHTPTPLYPADAEQTHQWWAGWQAVGHVQDKAGLPEGIYRLHVAGKRATGREDRWPWETETYTVEGPEFQLVPAVLDLVAVDDGLEISLAAPALGWRLVDMEGSSRGSNPVRGQVVVAWESGGVAESLQVEATVTGDRSHLPLSLPGDATAVTVTDVYGNAGTLP